MTRKPRVSRLVVDVLAALRALRNPLGIEGQRRFGIVTRYEQLGISVRELRAIGRPHRRDHELALALWASRVSDAMVLATLIDDPRKVSPPQMDRWARMCDNWGLTDALGYGLFDRTIHAELKAHEWSRSRSEFVKRCGFAMMAGMAVHRTELADDVFLQFLEAIGREATDERHFVRKSVNWALRQIGKRSPLLLHAAIAEAERMATLESASARWVARDALRDLTPRMQHAGAAP